MLEYVSKNTIEYTKTQPKEKRKAFGQFFTSKETARFMASLLLIPDKSEISILDPGAGSGILSAALIERLQGRTNIHTISLTCYETDTATLPLLKENLEYIKNKSRIPLTFEVKEENFITSQAAAFQGTAEIEKNYDMVICNPPYKKLGKNAPEALAMPSVCSGAPNAYFLFATMALFCLFDGGEMSFIMPRSWASGAYFRAFRAYLFSNGSLRHIHLFVSRDKVFDTESVLQETVIIKISKSTERPPVIISCSNANDDFENITQKTAPYDTIVRGNENYVFLPVTEKDYEVLTTLSHFNHTLPDLGFKMKTGLVVEYRSRNVIKNTPQNNVPFLCPRHIRSGSVVFPGEESENYICRDKEGLLQRNQNYLLVKRFTSKEEHRRLQCAAFCAKDFAAWDKISTHNKLNFIEGINAPLTEEQLFGLYVVFNSTMYDVYYRILNGSTQVNSTEINAMPVPSLEEIENLGTAILRVGDLSTKACDVLLDNILSSR